MTNKTVLRVMFLKERREIHEKSTKRIKELREALRQEELNRVWTNNDWILFMKKHGCEDEE